MAPTYVNWRIGAGIDTGNNVLAGADYACDASGSGCFRHKLNQPTSGAALPP